MNSPSPKSIALFPGDRGESAPATDLRHLTVGPLLRLQFCALVHRSQVL